jgi:hypothetical protein
LPYPEQARWTACASFDEFGDEVLCFVGLGKKLPCI